MSRRGLVSVLLLLAVIRSTNSQFRTTFSSRANLFDPKKRQFAFNRSQFTFQNFQSEKTATTTPTTNTITITKAPSRSPIPKKPVAEVSTPIPPRAPDLLRPTEKLKESNDVVKLSTMETKARIALKERFSINRAVTRHNALSVSRTSVFSKAAADKQDSLPSPSPAANSTFSSESQRSDNSADVAIPEKSSSLQIKSKPKSSLDSSSIRNDQNRRRVFPASSQVLLSIPQEKREEAIIMGQKKETNDNIVIDHDQNDGDTPVRQDTSPRKVEVVLEAGSTDASGVTTSDDVSMEVEVEQKRLDRRPAAVTSHFSRQALAARLRILVAEVLQQRSDLTLQEKVERLRTVLAEETPVFVRSHLRSAQFAQQARELFQEHESLITSTSISTAPTTSISTTTARTSTTTSGPSLTPSSLPTLSQQPATRSDSESVQGLSSKDRSVINHPGRRVHSFSTLSTSKSVSTLSSSSNSRSFLVQDLPAATSSSTSSPPSRRVFLHSKLSASRLPIPVSQESSNSREMDDHTRQMIDEIFSYVEVTVNDEEKRNSETEDTNKLPEIEDEEDGMVTRLVRLVKTLMTSNSPNEVTIMEPKPNKEEIVLMKAADKKRMDQLRRIVLLSEGLKSTSDESDRVVDDDEEVTNSDLHIELEDGDESEMSEIMKRLVRLSILNYPVTAPPASQPSYTPAPRRTAPFTSTRPPHLDLFNLAATEEEEAEEDSAEVEIGKLVSVGDLDVIPILSKVRLVGDGSGRVTNQREREERGLRQLRIEHSLPVQLSSSARITPVIIRPSTIKSLGGIRRFFQ